MAGFLTVSRFAVEGQQDKPVDKCFLRLTVARDLDYGITPTMLQSLFEDALPAADTSQAAGFIVTSGDGAPLFKVFAA